MNKSQKAKMKEEKEINCPKCGELVFKFKGEQYQICDSCQIKFDTPSTSQQPQVEEQCDKKCRYAGNTCITYHAPPREERDWDSWTEEFDDEWVDEHAEIVKADPKQLKVWIHNLLNSQLQEVRRRIEVNSFERINTPGIRYITMDRIEKIFQALDEMEGGK